MSTLLEMGRWRLEILSADFAMQIAVLAFDREGRAAGQINHPNRQQPTFWPWQMEDGP